MITLNRWQQWYRSITGETMGFEFKIITRLTLEEQEQIKELIPEAKNEEVSYKDELKFDEDGIYICKYRSSNLWEGFEKLKQYLENKTIPYMVEEI
jgi:hypothetical protein